MYDITELQERIYRQKGIAVLPLNPHVRIKGEGFDRSICAVYLSGPNRRVIFIDANFHHRPFDLMHLRDGVERDAIGAALLERVSLLMPVGI